jgi:hypothetical protein
MKTPKVETEEQRKIREAQEVVKQAKEKEQQAWREKWQAQQADPEYQRKQAERNAKSEERSRKIAIGKENAQLARDKKIQQQVSYIDKDTLEHIAYHEAGHAMMQEVLSNGCTEATIMPTSKDGKVDDKAEKLEIASLGHMMPNGELPVSKRQRAVAHIAVCLAGGCATEKAGWEPWGTQTDNKQVEQTLDQFDKEERKGILDEATAVCIELLEAPRMWAAVEAIKEMLLTEKTISGKDVRALCKMQYYPTAVHIDVTKQLHFHYRKNRYKPTYGTGPDSSFVLGIGLGTGYGWAPGFPLSEPDYVKKVRQENAKPIPFPVSYRTQLSLFNAPAPVKKSRKKKVAV